MRVGWGVGGECLSLFVVVPLVTIHNTVFDDPLAPQQNSSAIVTTSEPASYTVRWRRSVIDKVALVSVRWGLAAYFLYVFCIAQHTHNSENDSRPPTHTSEHRLQATVPSQHGQHVPTWRATTTVPTAFDATLWGAQPSEP